MSKKKCTLCEKPSVPGLKPGHGKCQYHWDVGCYGKAWADKCRAEFAAHEPMTSNHWFCYIREYGEWEMVEVRSDSPLTADEALQACDAPLGAVAIPVEEVACGQD